jgi:cytosine/adenosine deaminase-related metal-dependent hydrolase
MTTNGKKNVCIDGNTKKQFHRAGWVVVDSCTIIENGCIEVENGRISSIHKAVSNKKYIDHGPGVLMPPLVNAHLHLELSALKNTLPFDKGFKTWVKALLVKREALGEEKLIIEAKKAVMDLLKSGNLYVGDISTLGITEQIYKSTGLNGVCFREFLGTDVDASVETFFARENDSLSFSVAGHAPHTTSTQLLKALKKGSKSCGMPFSIHVAESDDESEFIHDKKGQWAKFLTSRGIDFSSWEIGSKTPVSYLNDIGLLDTDTIAVHLLNVNGNDLKMIADSKSKVCVCPKSNMNLHGKLPDIEMMLQSGIHPALGTDSLASCDSLDIFDEMAFVNKYYLGIAPETIFSMGTINGAKALGLEQLTGTLSIGKKAQFIYRPVNIINKKDLFQRIISNE